MGEISEGEKVFVAILTAALLVSSLLVAVLGSKGIKKRNKLLLFQFGEFVNTRPGIKNHPYWNDESDVVEFVDYKYWIRLYPNPGVNLPVLGYWSKFKGRRR